MSAANGKEILIAVKDMKKHFPIMRGVFRRQVGAVLAVDGVTFDIYRGETLGLVGESGCGKTTISSKLETILNLPSIDLDQFIENELKMSISQIFNSKGQIEFRKIENC